jgi:hypothetical protein
MRDQVTNGQGKGRTTVMKFCFLRNPLSWIQALVICALTSGCIKVDAADKGSLDVTAHVKNPVIGVQASSLANALTGSFDMTISVGRSSTSGADFSDPPSFALVAAQQGTSITPLDAVVEDDPFPLSLEPGKSTTLSFTLSRRNAVTSEQLATLCGGPVEVVAVLQDASGDHGTSAVSSPTSATGCF